MASACAARYAVRKGHNSEQRLGGGSTMRLVRASAPEGEQQLTRSQPNSYPLLVQFKE
jgi:hypothetical protein